MGINIEKVRLPVEFEIEDNTDDRFKEVKIWVAHTGENLNNSYFSKDVLEEMSNTLGRVPIVGYVEKNDDNDDDFSDHRNKITIKSGKGIDIDYAGHAYGFIPPNPEYDFEFRNGKEWLTVRGYLWNKFKGAMNIFEDSNGKKSQSMEIDNAEGEVDDIGRIVFSSARFSALCILGEDVPPAMTGSTIEFFSNKKDQYQFELKHMMEEFEKEKGDFELKDRENKDITIDNQEEFQADNSAEEVKEDVATENSEFVKDEDKEEADKETKTDEEEEEEKDKDFSTEPDKSKEELPGDQAEFTAKTPREMDFELSHEGIRGKLYSALSAKEESGYNYILDVFDNHVIFERISWSEDERNADVFNASYEVLDEEVVIGKEEQVFAMYLNASEKESIQNQRDEIKNLTSQLEELTKFQTEINNSKKEDLVNEFAENLDEETVSDIRSKFSDLSVEEVEKEIAFQCFKKIKVEKNEEQDSVSVGVNNFSTKESRYGALDRFFNN